MNKPRYNIVLVKPDIAGNTGQIGRSCMALDCRLHLVHPLGYEISDKHLKRAGMDYWPKLDLVEHASVDAWIESMGDEEPWLLSTKGSKNFTPALIAPGATVVFGSETAGLPEQIWGKWKHRALRLPMRAEARSLNLSASVAMTLGALVFNGET